MKRIMCLMVSILLCFSLYACGNKKITTEEVNEALSGNEGNLKIEADGDYVKSFTYVENDVNTDDLVNREYCIEAIEALLSGDDSKITFGHLMVSEAILALMRIESIFEDNDNDFNSDAFVDKLLDVICDGKTLKHDGWKISSEINQDDNSITFYVTK